MKGNDSGGRSFKDGLNACHDWPCSYTFKFITPAGAEDTVRGLLEGLLKDAEFSVRPSGKGNWVSISATAKLASAEEVLSVYERLAGIEGVIAL